jgi:eukaryotic-like serine/threonine-protein kinase
LVYLFDGYELDDESFCLTKGGQRMPLEPKSIQVLLLMVTSQGKLLEKAAILDVVWKDTFVEESTLSRSIALIRKQLGDDPRSPKYIETVPTRGYRFIARVENASLASQSGSSIPVEEPASTPLGKGDSPSLVDLKSDATDAVNPAPRRARRPTAIWATILGGLLSVAGAATFWVIRHRQPVLTDNDTLVLADFANSTGDPVFDGTLRLGLIEQLKQSPLLSIVPDQRIQSTLRLMSRPPGARLTPELGRELCQRTGSIAILDGSIANVGTQYVLGLRATNCHTGKTLDEEQAQVARKEDVLSALDNIASRFRRRVGESLASVRERYTPLQEATTPSLDALKAYTTALEVLPVSGSSGAIPFFRRAIELDPEFAMAYSHLGRMYADIGEETLSAENTAQAYRFRNRASEAERFFIDASYQMQVTGNLEKAQETCETWIHSYPREFGPHGFLSGVILRTFGKYEEGAENAKRFIDLNPDFPIGYHLLAVNDIRLGRLDEAEAVLHQAAERDFAMPEYGLDRYRIAFLRGDLAGMQTAAAVASKHSGAEDAVERQEASSLAYFGHLREAREISQRAIDRAHRLGKLDSAARFEAEAAIREAFFGNAQMAKADAFAALKLSKSRDSQYGAAFALALAQDSSQALALADDLERRFPEDTVVRFHYVPSIRGIVALNHKDYEQVISLLRGSLPYDFGAPQSGYFSYYGALYTVYVRGLAYLSEHRGAEAAAEFQKIIDHRGVVVSDPIGALAYLQLARAYALTGGKSEEKLAYQTLLKLWMTGDSDISVLRQAKAADAQCYD